MRTYCSSLYSAMAMLLKVMTTRLDVGMQGKPLQCKDACYQGAERTHRHHQRTEVRPRMNPPLSNTSSVTTTLHVTNVLSSQSLHHVYGHVTSKLTAKYRGKHETNKKKRHAE